MKKSIPFAMTLIALSLMQLKAVNAAETHNSVCSSDKTDGSLSQHLCTKTTLTGTGDKSLLNTPYSVTTVTADDVNGRSVSSVGDLFKYDAGTMDTANVYNAWAGYLSVRGLRMDVRNSYTIDGMPFISTAAVMPVSHFERVNLIKGVTGYADGIGEPGGMVDYQLKKPTDKRIRSVDVGYKSDSIWQEHIDLGDRFGQDNMFGYRLNVTHEGGNAYNDSRINRNAVSLALDARLTRDLTWDFASLYQNFHSDDPSITIKYDGSDNLLPPAISGRDNSSYPNIGQKVYSKFQFYSTGLTYQINPDWLWRTQVSHAKNQEDHRLENIYLTDGQGNYTLQPYQIGSVDYQVDAAKTYLQGHVVTGSLQHQIVLGADWKKVRYSDLETASLDHDTTKQLGVFGSDTVTLNDNWSVLAGLRAVQLKQNVVGDDVTAYSYNYKKSAAVLPTAAIMYHFSPSTMTYVSYQKSLEDSDMVSSYYTNRTAILTPATSNQYEWGVKTSQDRWSATAALFRIETAYGYTHSDDAFMKDGKSVYNGLELSATTRLGTQWHLAGSAMILDSDYHHVDADVGNTVSGAPKLVLASQVTYDVPGIEGLNLQAGARYIGKTMLNDTNSIQLSSYTLADLGATYRTKIAGYHTTFNAAVTNVADKKYWAYQRPGYIAIGSPRTFSLNAKLDF